MLPDKLFISVIAEDLKDKIVILTQTDELAQTIIKCLGKQLPLPMRTALSDWKNIDNLILYKSRVYVPTDADLCREIVTSFHDSPTTGHPGFFKTAQLLKEHYWWPGMTVFLKKYIEGCTICQQMKPNTHPTAAPLMPIKSYAQRPFQQITMDFIMDLLLSDGFDSIFVVVNQGLSKGNSMCL
jgi:hypothetical protein